MQKKNRIFSNQQLKRIYFELLAFYLGNFSIEEIAHYLSGKITNEEILWSYFQTLAKPTASSYVAMRRLPVFVNFCTNLECTLASFKVRSVDYEYLNLNRVYDLNKEFFCRWNTSGNCTLKNTYDDGFSQANYPNHTG